MNSEPQEPLKRSSIVPIAYLQIELKNRNSSSGFNLGSRKSRNAPKFNFTEMWVYLGSRVGARQSQEAGGDEEKIRIFKGWSGSKIPTIPFVKFPPLTKTKKTVALISFSFRKLKVMSGVLEESQKNRNSILAWLGGT